MILSVTFSKPTKDCERLLGRQYIRVRIWKNKNSDSEAIYAAEYFTDKQSFRKTMTAADVDLFIKEHSGTTFKCCIVRTESEEITTLANRHGEKKELRKMIKDINFNPEDKSKKYILQEGISVPFLVKLSVMSDTGKVIESKYDKFRQINRFLEFIRDVIPEVTKLISIEENTTEEKTFTQERPLRIADFGCGKSYLTFAVYYYLKELRNIPVEIIGLDLKADVIKDCSDLAKRSHYERLNFFVGNIADYKNNNEIPEEFKKNPDIVITLHACDTATDFAIANAVKNNAKAILSVPCCQHEINTQLEKTKALTGNDNPFSSLERYGLIRERFAALATDAIRAEKLEQFDYSVQVLEFIEMEHTPKNVLIRAVKKQITNAKAIADEKKVIAASKERVTSLLDKLHVSVTLDELLQD